MKTFRPFQKRVIGIGVALVIAITSISQPITVFAYWPTEIATLNEESKAIVLSDFEYLAEILIENAPFHGPLYRRFDITMEELLDNMRQWIKEMRPMLSFTTLGLGDRWEAEPTDDLYRAADYLYTLLVALGLTVRAMGHMGPMGTEEFTGLITQIEVMQYALDNDPDAAAEFDDRLIEWFHDVREVFTQPASLWLYDISLEDIDITMDLAELRPRNEDNVTTRSIDPGRVAYMRIDSWANCYEFDGEIFLPFFESIQNYEHLIIDIQGNPGGLPAYVTKIIGALIAEPLDFVYYEFFAAGEMAVRHLDINMVFGVTADDILNAYEVIEANNLTGFNQEDLARIEYAVRWDIRLEPMENNTPFLGDIWILVDGGSASASELIALIAIDTGFATVVGKPTWGVTPAQAIYVSLPQTGIIFRLDIGSLIDETGRSIEEFGVTPQVANAEGMDALETVLSMINS